MVKISAEFSILICTHLLFVKLKYIQQRENRLSGQLCCKMYWSTKCTVQENKMCALDHK